MNALWSVLVFFLLGGCTAAYVANEAISANQAIKAAINDNIVSNILRARDGVSTFFSDISHFRGSLQEGTGRFRVTYQGQEYAIHGRQHRIGDPLGCHNGPGDRGCEDHTLEILTLVNQLIDLHKNGRELPTTGAFQVVN